MSSKITQTELGKEFGISSISMGKKLIELKKLNIRLYEQLAEI